MPQRLNGSNNELGEGLRFTSPGGSFLDVLAAQPGLTNVQDTKPGLAAVMSDWLLDCREIRPFSGQPIWRM